MPSAFEKYAKSNVPRYTSYPTAPHFSTHFPAASYREWLARLDPDEPVSLYLHVPFCKQMCWYCGCNMKLAARYSPVATYVQHLLEEIDLIASALPSRMPVSHLHFGGGTP
ncbi:MAG TPA: coproporphyrinogen III oxidase, partial [Bradyrhizobium sp.]